MPVTVKQLTINTTVSKSNGGVEKNQPNVASSSNKVSKAEQEKIIRECLNRVREMIETEYKP